MAMVDEAEIDSDALQAQIDVALSAAYGLVTSWMKTGAESGRKRDANQSEREFEEYARRPARLGLGASVPKSEPVRARDAAKLAHKLAGPARAKRPREEDAGPRAAAGSDDDDEDSRAGAISNKARPLPNGVPDSRDGVGKPKKKKPRLSSTTAEHAASSYPDAVTLPPPSLPHQTSDNDLAGQSAALPPHDATLNGDDAAPARKKKKKRRKKTNALVLVSTATPAFGPDSPVAAASSPATGQQTATVSTSAKHDPASPTSASSSSDDAPAVTSSRLPAPSKATALAVPAQFPTSAATHDHAPVLNLEGPPPDVAGDQSLSDLGGYGPVEGDETAQKKKRKRKKKKKNKSQADDGT